MNGRIVAGGIVAVALIAGAVMYWVQVYAFYTPVTLRTGAEMMLTPLASEVPEPMLAENFEGIDAASSPLRFRACFTTPMSLAMLTETYRIYPAADPLLAPRWFGCFDAAAIGAALQSGEAVAFLSEKVVYSVTDPVTGVVRPSGVDRVIAVYGDGRAYAWHQLSGPLDT